MKEHYKIYIESYGKVQSGTKLERKDYGSFDINGFLEYDEKEMAAVSLAAQDVKMNIPMKSKKEFEEKLNELFS